VSLTPPVSLESLGLIDSGSLVPNSLMLGGLIQNLERKHMFYESEVVNAVCDYLTARGYEIHQRLKTTDHGDDIVAIRELAPRRRLCIEAKGETSERKNSSGFGHPFSPEQVRTHVAMALYKVAEILSRETQDPGIEIRGAMAFPNNRDHERAVKKIHGAIEALGIGVFWVNEDGLVTFSAGWSLGTTGD